MRLFTNFQHSFKESHFYKIISSHLGKQIILGTTIVTIIVLFLSLAIILARASNASQGISPFSKACIKLGLAGKEIEIEQDGQTSLIRVSEVEAEEALLRIFQMAGYFKPDNLWKDIYYMGDVNDPKAFYASVVEYVQKSGADQDDPGQFNAKFLRKNLFKNTNISTEEAADWIVYLSQNAFGRKNGAEPSEVPSEPWMEKYKDQFFNSAKKLGLIDRTLPAHKDYDLAWISGGPRLDFTTRTIDYIQLLKSDKIRVLGDTLALTGERPIWAEIDAISPSTKEKLNNAIKDSTNIDSLDFIVSNSEEEQEEGKDYILLLAGKNCIKLDGDQPFFSCLDSRDCPNGYLPNRTYPNYSPKETRKLTESLMATDILNNYASGNKSGIKLVSINLCKDNLRPTTETTVKDATNWLIERIKTGVFEEKTSLKILLQTNNPSIERQTLTAQMVVDNELEEAKKAGLDKKYTIKIDGVGLKNKNDVKFVDSELAALIATKYKYAGIKSSKELSSLLYQNRPDRSDSDFIGTPPDLSEYDNKPKTIFKRLVEFFDWYYE